MNNLAPYTEFVTMDGGIVRIVRRIGFSGGKEIYEVEYDGKACILIWLVQGCGSTEEFRSRVVSFTRGGAPSDAFLWPLAVTHRIGDEWGYVVSRIDRGYQDISDLLASGQLPSASLATRVEICMQISDAFEALHACGYHYLSVDPGYFMVNEATHRVLACFGEHIATADAHTPYLSVPRYMAPELVERCFGEGNQPNTGDVSQSELTDLWSLAVILFIVLLLNHPLEGRRASEAILMAPDSIPMLYGMTADFAFGHDNPEDHLDPVANSYACGLWSTLPAHMKEAFEQAFGKEAIVHPERRLRPADWKRELTLLSREIKRYKTHKAT